jgi:hypothetical protein
MSDVAEERTEKVPREATRIASKQEEQGNGREAAE